MTETKTKKKKKPKAPIMGLPEQQMRLCQWFHVSEHMPPLEPGKQCSALHLVYSSRFESYYFGRYWPEFGWCHGDPATASNLSYVGYQHISHWLDGEIPLPFKHKLGDSDDDS